MEKKHVKLVVLIPVGPDETLEYLHDTIESVIKYTGPSKKIVLIDNDGGKGITKKIACNFDNMIVITNEFGFGVRSSSYYAMGNAFKHILNLFSFDVCLKMDIDALIIGDNPEDDAIDYFKKNPGVGAIGSFLYDCTGRRRNCAIHGKRIKKDMKKSEYIRTALEKAVLNGYDPGEHCQGGAYFISYACIQKMNAEGCFNFEDLSWSIIYDDVLFSLMMNSAGFKNGDFAIGKFPFGVRWRGLPLSPQELVRRGKKIIHSVKFYKSLKQDEIRFYFCKRRLLEDLK